MLPVNDDVPTEIVEDPDGLTLTTPLTVSPPSVPTDVSDDAVTPLANVDPVNVPAAAVIVILPLPSNVVPFIVRPVCNVVAVKAFPVHDADAPVQDAEDPFIFAEIVHDTANPLNDNEFDH